MAAVWCSLPESHSAAPSPDERRELQSYLDDFEAGRIETLPWEVVQRLMAGESYAKPAKIYSVPRRFDLATIFVVTLAYSLLFGVMKAIGLPQSATAIIAAFIMLVGAAQALLFGGKQPRTASIVAGAVLYLLAITAAWVATGPRLYSVSQLLVPASLTIAGGGILGYLSGVMIGGVFLVADKLRSRLSRRQAALNPDASPDELKTTDRGNDPWTS
jgi:hypothetical protein